MRILNNDLFHIEERFNYKDCECICGLNYKGYRYGYVIFPIFDEFCKTECFEEIIDTNLNCEINFSSRDSERHDHIVFEFSYDHFHNKHDIENLKKYFPNNVDIIKKVEELDEYADDRIIGTLDMCIENCKLICYNIDREKKKLNIE